LYRGRFTDLRKKCDVKIFKAQSRTVNALEQIKRYSSGGEKDLRGVGTQRRGSELGGAQRKIKTKKTQGDKEGRKENRSLDKILAGKFWSTK